MVEVYSIGPNSSFEVEELKFPKTLLVFLRFFRYYFIQVVRALSSAWLERYLDMVEVIGSSPIGPTIICDSVRIKVKVGSENYF